MLQSPPPPIRTGVSHLHSGRGLEATADESSEEQGSDRHSKHTKAMSVASGNLGAMTNLDSSLKEFWKSSLLSNEAYPPPSLKCLLKRELGFAVSQGASFLTRLTTGIGSLLLLVLQDLHVRTCQVFIFRSRSSRSKTFSSHSVFSFATNFGSSLTGPNHSASASVAERQSMTLSWLLCKFKIVMEKKRGSTSLRKVSGNPEDLEYEWESGSHKNPIDPMPTLASKLDELGKHLRLSLVHCFTFWKTLRALTSTACLYYLSARR